MSLSVSPLWIFLPSSRLSQGSVPLTCLGLQPCVIWGPVSTVLLMCPGRLLNLILVTPLKRRTGRGYQPYLRVRKVMLRRRRFFAKVTQLAGGHMVWKAGCSPMLRQCDDCLALKPQPTASRILWKPVCPVEGCSLLKCTEID